MTRIGPTRTRILALILDGCERGFPPTYRDMSKKTELAVHAVENHVKALVREGLIERDATVARGLRAKCVFLTLEEVEEIG